MQNKRTNKVGDHFSGIHKLRASSGDRMSHATVAGALGATAAGPREYQGCDGGSKRGGGARGSIAAPELENQTRFKITSYFSANSAL
jgi:hypothetical protein